MMKHIGRRALATAMVALGAQVTSVLASPVAPKSALAPGTDGKCHVVYELLLTNATQFAAALEKIEILDAGSPSRASPRSKAAIWCRG